MLPKIDSQLGGQSEYTFVLRVHDKPGLVEAVAATFAHRGVSITSILGNDSALDEQGHATVLVTFSASRARKEALRNALRCHSRVVSLTERRTDDAQIRKTALVRLKAGTPMPVITDPDVHCDQITSQSESGNIVIALFGAPGTIDGIIEELKRAGSLVNVTYSIVAL